MAENHSEIQVTKTNNMKLPKNIRQMGTPADRQKVYIEDYVYTYLHSFLKEKYREDTLKAAVVLGEYYERDGVTYTFMKGAVSCEFSQLHEEVSKELSQTIRNYFPGWDMLGWYVASQGVDSHIQSEIKHHYAGCQSVIPQYLIYEDELERDIQVFAWEQNALHYLNGYYIYYEKNPRMQEFLIMEKGGRPQEMPTLVQKQEKVFNDMENVVGDRTSVADGREKETNDRKNADNDSESVEATKTRYKTNVARTMNDMREVMEKDTKKKGKRPQRIVYAACIAVLVVLVAMGITQIGDYQNLRQLQEAISSTVIPVWDNNEEPSAVEDPSDEGMDKAPEDAATTSEEDMTTSTEENTTTSTEEDATTSSEGVVISPPGEAVTLPADEQMTLPAQAQGSDLSEGMEQETFAQETPEYYEVKEGDSLISISRAVYENEDMVSAICELNGITNVHLIFEGQTLKLP